MENLVILKEARAKNEEKWEVTTDFTKIKKGGVDIDEVLARL